MNEEKECPICDRELVPGPSIDKHHLVPKCKGGKETSFVHKICHQKIHATFSETELAQYYFTAERIRSHEQIAKFIKWVASKHPEFYDKNKDTNHRKQKRKRK